MRGASTAQFKWLAKPVSCAADSVKALSVCTPQPLSVTPAPGATYTDPNFGGEVSIVAPGVHQYSGISPLSLGDKYLHVMNEANGGSSILNAASGRVVRTGSNVPYPECHWSNTSDDVCYYFSPEKPQIMRYRVSKDDSDVLIDYSDRFTGRLADGATTDLSKDEWLAFWAQDQHTVCAVDLKAKATYCADYKAPDPRALVPINNIDYVSISRGVDAVSGKRYVVIFGDPLAIYSVDTANRRLALEARPDSGPGNMGNNPKNNADGICQPGETCPTNPHGDVFEAPDGQQFFIYEAGYQGTFSGSYHCELTLSTVRLNAGGKAFTDSTLGGGLTRVLPISLCGTTWQSYHVGCARNKPVCVVSTDGGANAEQDGKTPYFNEVFLVSFDRGAAPAITPVAMHHSSESKYWTQPRAALNFSGDTIVFDSDFGGPKLFVSYARPKRVAAATEPQPKQQER